MSRITTFLTYRDGAEAAAQHYVSIFKNSRITATSRYPEGSGYPVGSVMTVSFELDGQPFTALNGGDHFKFTDAFSLSIQCETQDEIDHYTNRLIEGGGEEGPCGWVRDRWGVSWQVTPTYLINAVTGADRAKASRVMQAMMTMKRIDIRKLEEAAKG